MVYELLMFEEHVLLNYCMHIIAITDEKDYAIYSFYSH